MYSRDEFYALQATLNNLALLKIAYDAGVPKEIFVDYEVTFEFGIDPGMDNFLTAVAYLFETVEWYSPYDDDSLEDKEYWLQLADFDPEFSLEPLGVLVLMDDVLRPFDGFAVEGNYYEGWYTGFGELRSIEKGIVFITDEDDGAIDYTDALRAILYVLKQSERSYEHEMAV